LSLNRLFRYAAGLIIGWLLMYFLLPLVGFPKSKFLPPGSIYNNAEGKTNLGYISGKRDPQTDNPFRVGDKLHFIDYRFKAPDPADPTGKTKSVYLGTVPVSKETYDGATVGGTLDVKYEKTYPWINGITDKDPSTDKELGISCGPGSNILSGWIIFAVLSLFLAFGIMMIIERFTGREDI